MKKTLVITMIVIVMLNFIPIRSYAVINEDEPISTKPQEDGDVELENSEGNKTNAGITGTTYSGSVTFKAVAVTLSLIPQCLNKVMNLFINSTTNYTENGKRVSTFTIYHTVMGHYDIFNINYLNLPDNLNEISKNANVGDVLKIATIKFYNIIRNICLAASVFILIYLGIRLAITSVATEKSKYNTLLVHWVTSVVLMFFMQFIIIIISVVLQQGLGIIEKIAQAWGVSSFEEQIYTGAISNLSSHGFNMVAALAIIYLLVAYQLKFFFYYIKRFLEVSFLITISPLITITYSIDKAGDSKAQAFTAFFTELVMKCAMQLVHAITYVVFIASAGVIAQKEPLLAIFFFTALSRAEKIIRKTLAIDGPAVEDTKIPFTH